MDDVCFVDEVKSEADSSSLGKTLRTSFGNIGHSIANACGKAPCM